MCSKWRNSQQTPSYSDYITRQTSLYTWDLIIKRITVNCIHQHKILRSQVYRVVFAKVTLSLMLACSLLVTAVQLVTDPITCDVKGVSSGIFNAFCWSHTTFTLPYNNPGTSQESLDRNCPRFRYFRVNSSKFQMIICFRFFSANVLNDKKRERDDLIWPDLKPSLNYHATQWFVGPTIQPGVGPEIAGVEAAPAVHHSYYQWVGMALFVLSMAFYVPHFIWKTCEGKRVERLVSGDFTSQISQTSHVLARNYVSYCKRGCQEETPSCHRRIFSS